MSNLLKHNSTLRVRHLKAQLFAYVCLAVTWLGVLLLAVLLYQVISSGYKWLDWQFFTSFPSRFPEKTGLYSAFIGTLWLMTTTAMIAIPIGVSAAIYLEEFAKKGRLSSFIELNISNLAGVPSIVNEPAITLRSR